MHFEVVAVDVEARLTDLADQGATVAGDLSLDTAFHLSPPLGNSRNCELPEAILP
jgi:hypothetical protein